jgi:uncharacterized membrane protein YdbT with pleckstrin-like domain
MASLHAVGKSEPVPRVVWEAFPSWAQFLWLYLLSAISALRGGVFFKFGVGGWELWIIGAGALLLCAVILRHWGYYRLTGEQLIVRNGYTGREIQSLPLNDVRQVAVQQGIVAAFFGIGSLLVQARSSDSVLTLRGVRDPEEVKIRIEALVWRHNRITHQPSTNG